VKEHPSVVVERTILGKNSDKNTYSDPPSLSIGAGPISYSQDRIVATQGYKFTLGDMHGKPKRKSTYSGVFIPNQRRDQGNESCCGEDDLVGSQVFTYSELGEKMNVLKKSENGFYLDKKELGTEEDLTMYNSKVVDEYSNVTVELDINLIATSITLGLAPSFTYSRSTFLQHVTNKVVRKVSYLKETRASQDGRVTVTRNLAFDEKTGDPILTVSNDGYLESNELDVKGDFDLGRGWYYNLDIPASLVQGYFGQKHDSEGNSNQLDVKAGKLVTYGQIPLKEGVNNATKSFNNVVSASVTSFENELFGHITNDNVKAVLNTRYYPRKSYVYRNNTEVGNTQQNNKVFSSGIYDGVELLDWANLQSDNTDGTNWYSSSEITEYHRTGAPVEQKNALGIYSSVKLGYDDQLPVMTVSNAKRDEVCFYDFEYETAFFDNNGIENGDAHTGNKSFVLSAAPDKWLVKDISVPSDNRDGLFMFWVKSNLSKNPNDALYGKQNQQPNIQAIIGSNSLPMNKLAQTGEWSLYKVRVPSTFISGSQVSIKVAYDFLPNEVVLIDDVRYQPYDAEGTCSVYRKDFRVVAQFDSQHFAVFYEYDSEGNLVRKSIETEEGKKTLQEQYSNTPRIAR
jgi:hypothetical protein